ncbi:hypothetical protein ACFWXK_22730 [Streptomyces sp. NPDC059070]|uniref:hypothetical protein n=1 Tax=Streptomyces sp. NPDC059070 TaxID=3346713 RepID=UPI0036885CE0
MSTAAVAPVPSHLQEPGGTASGATAPALPVRRQPGASGALPREAWVPDSSAVVLQRLLGALRGTGRGDTAARMRSLLSDAVDQLADVPSASAQEALGAARAALQYPGDEHELRVLTQAAQALLPFSLDPGHAPQQPAAAEPGAVYTCSTAMDPARVRDRMNRLYLACARSDGEVVASAVDVCAPEVPLAQRPQWRRHILPGLADGTLTLLVVWDREDLLSPAPFTDSEAYEQAWGYFAAWFTARGVRLLFRSRHATPPQVSPLGEGSRS